MTLGCPNSWAAQDPSCQRFGRCWALGPWREPGMQRSNVPFLHQHPSLCLARGGTWLWLSHGPGHVTPPQRRQPCEWTSGPCPLPGIRGQPATAAHWTCGLPVHWGSPATCAPSLSPSLTGSPLCSVLCLHQPVSTGDQPWASSWRRGKTSSSQGTEGPPPGAGTLGRAGLAKPLDLASPGRAPESHADS